MPSCSINSGQKRANVLNTKYDVVREVLTDAGYSLSRSEQFEEELLWIDSGVTLQHISKLKQHQKINHYPEMYQIYRKDFLSRNMARMRSLLPHIYNFYPPTFSSINELKHNLNQSTSTRDCFIAKPSASAQGKGVILFKSISDETIQHLQSLERPHHSSNTSNSNSNSITSGGGYVIQRYISNPYLIDDLKFDLRIYVLVYAIDPDLKAIVFHEGLARFSTCKYDPPSTSNLENKFMHLTNYAINKFSRGYSRESKRSLKDVLSLIIASQTHHHQDGKEEGEGKEGLWERIKNVISNTLILAKPFISETKLRRVENCFEILGFDILIDQHLKPWVLEVNHAPSFTCDEPIDLHVKQTVLKTSLKIVHNPELVNDSRLLDIKIFDRLCFDGEALEAAYCVYRRITRPTKCMLAREDYRARELADKKRKDDLTRRMYELNKRRSLSLPKLRVKHQEEQMAVNQKRESIRQRQTIELPKINFCI